ncbi:MAG: ABC transporter ATP-binding protein [bacterium]|nr:ABC transporter ATP-binding protein [bacterium]
MEIVKAEKIKKDYYIGKLTHTALHEIDLSIGTGEFVAIAGPSGSGKTTLLNLIGCLDKPTEGDIIVDDVKIRDLNSNSLSDLRNEKIGFIFQTFNLIPVLTAFENVELPLLLKSGFTIAKRKEMVSDILEKVGLKDFMDRRPNELSGGQQQRVAVARALVKQPKLVLADEPTANLDSSIGMSILEIMKKLNKEQQISFIFSTHDKMVMDIASRLIILRDGKIKEEITQNNNN